MERVKSKSSTCCGSVIRCVSGTDRPSDAASAVNACLSSRVRTVAASRLSTSQCPASTSAEAASNSEATGEQTGTYRSTPSARTTSSSAAA